MASEFERSGGLEYAIFLGGTREVQEVEIGTYLCVWARGVRLGRKRERGGLRKMRETVRKREKNEKR